MIALIGYILLLSHIYKLNQDKSSFSHEQLNPKERNFQDGSVFILRTVVSLFLFFAPYSVEFLFCTCSCALQAAHGTEGKRF